MAGANASMNLPSTTVTETETEPFKETEKPEINNPIVVLNFEVYAVPHDRVMEMV